MGVARFAGTDNARLLCRLPHRTPIAVGSGQLIDLPATSLLHSTAAFQSATFRRSNSGARPLGPANVGFLDQAKEQRPTP